MFKTMVLVCTI
uniref:Uncharacterized protein n=1 Tax=Arundo donax TaxID=35708 RepID=A0A0A9CC22_ARUDO